MAERSFLTKHLRYVNNEMQKLRDLHQDSLKKRLKMRKFMTTIVLRWKSLSLSIFFRWFVCSKWKSVSKTPPDHIRELMLLRRSLNVRREEQKNRIQRSRNKHFRHTQLIGIELRNEKMLIQVERSNKMLHALRTRSADVQKRRRSLVSSTVYARQRILEGNRAKASEVKAKSPPRHKQTR